MDPLSISDGLIMVESASSEPLNPVALQVIASAVGDVRSCTLLDERRRIVLEMFDDRDVSNVVREFDGKTIAVSTLGALQSIWLKMFFAGRAGLRGGSARR